MDGPALPCMHNQDVIVQVIVRFFPVIRFRPVLHLYCIIPIIGAVTKKHTRRVCSRPIHPPCFMEEMP